MSQNFYVTIEQFLLFWNRHNMSIIEGLVACIIIISLFLGYQLFFGKKAADHDLGGLDTSKLEETLERILQSQAGRPSNDSGTVAGSVYTAVEIDQMVASLAESDASIQELKNALNEAQAAVTAASANGGGGSGVSAQDKATYELKINDLETRLAEYEIIAEDIADLARYRDENEKLKKENAELRAEIERLKRGGAVAGVDMSPPPVQEMPDFNPVPSMDPIPEPEAPAAPVDDGPLIDDDLMAEFAAAVESQKAASAAGGGAEPESNDPETADVNNSETARLMNEFEEFTGKKS
jgi:DNA repair exonuclease SbcCD ATPase subunit